MVLTGIVMATDAESAPEDKSAVLIPTENKFVIAGNAVGMPAGRILLMRKTGQHCAVKLTEIKANKRGGWDMQYESYSSGRPEALKGQAYTREPKGIGHLLTLSSTGKDYLRCEPLTLQVSGSSYGWWVYFYERDTDQDKAVELAPTKWTEASQINFTDRSVAWYAFDDKRKRRDVRIESTP